jgi:RND family efflux transporter MFP subunit
MNDGSRNSKFKIQNANRAQLTPQPAHPSAVHILFAFFILHFALLISACTTEAEKPPAPPAAVRIGMENIVTVARGTIVVGPIVSGELRAEKEATVRAEIGGSVTQVNVREGQAVRKGTLLGRIETRTLDDVRQSAMSSERNAENQLAVARREMERTETLVKAGALAARDLDVARQNVTAAEAQLADAKSRVASADRQLADTVLRSPIDGLIAKRPVNAGDVVSVGAELFTVIDPSSMRLEASVPADDLSFLRIGAKVDFTVRGYEKPFEGRITMIAPQADPVTRQVPIYVSIPNVGGRLVAGLFAEGRVVSQSADGLVVPINAVNVTAPTPWVLRVANGKAERADVALGLRDPRTEQVLVTTGVSDGDTLLRGAAQGIASGTAVELSGR